MTLEKSPRGQVGCCLRAAGEARRYVAQGNVQRTNHWSRRTGYRSVLLEELLASPPFLAWYLRQIQLPYDAILTDAARSVFGDAIAAGAFAALVNDGEIHLFFPLSLFHNIMELLGTHSGLSLFAEVNEPPERLVSRGRDHDTCLTFQAILRPNARHGAAPDASTACFSSLPLGINWMLLASGDLQR